MRAKELGLQALAQAVHYYSLCCWLRVSPSGQTCQELVEPNPSVSEHKCAYYLRPLTFSLLTLDRYRDSLRQNIGAGCSVHFM